MDPRSRPGKLEVAVLAATVALLPAVTKAEIATVHRSPAGLSWSVGEPNEGVVLTVGGNGYAIQRAFGPGESPGFSLVDAEGNVLPDGHYNWELRPVPPTVDAGDPRPGAEGQGRARAPFQSGGFRILNGSLVEPSGAEPPGERASGGFRRGGALASRASASDPRSAASVPALQFINEDLVVEGSQCLGLDCAEAEVFGASLDTLRLKENNLRIKFVDTSAGEFATNDWELVANDELGGGPAYFAIRDDGDDGTNGPNVFRIDAGAPESSLFVDSAGLVGLGTSVPVQSLHVISSDALTLRLEQSPTDQQTWDVGGNETSFFVRDVTNDAETPFEILAGAPSDSLVIGAGGVTIGVPPSIPDFVFEPDYALLPLDELRHFVRENRHLPSVPAADAIQAQGLKLGEFQMALLQKVEELTLYTLAQEEVIAALGERLARVEATQIAAPAEIETN
jgi:hypothetical protein